VTGRPYNNTAYEGGAIRINRDGSFDVSGFRRTQASQTSADQMANAIRAAIPNAVIRTTPDRLSTLTPR
jgi:site-specific DNA-adenine methylase